VSVVLALATMTFEAFKLQKTLFFNSFEMTIFRNRPAQARITTQTRAQGRLWFRLFNAPRPVRRKLRACYELVEQN